MSQNFIVLAAMFGFMYFLLIRPQKKQMESRKRMMEGLAAGDVVSTIGGIKGTIKMVMEDSVILEIADNVNVELLKSAVGSVITDDEEAEDEEEDFEEETEEELEEETKDEKSL
ncbi:MAG: preprotein translocase subunit YajC [Eubacteriales bacterium]|jgi:preprotein translocase subunit YajC|nr:preprotein translocase subunit YajC [Eubacteriales bacterium]